MNSTIKISQGADFKAVFADVLKICERFWTDTKILEITVEPVFGKATSSQNKQQHAWFKEAENQGDMTAEEYRAMCKLHCGVPILREASAEYRKEYDALIKPLKYDQKLKLMAVPFDFAVTRNMNIRQKSEYLDASYKFLTVEAGIHLTRDEEQAA